MTESDILDCGDNSCLFKERGKGGMRTNGGCRCPQAKLKRRIDKLQAENAKLKEVVEVMREALDFYSCKPFKALGEWVIVEPGRMSDDFSTYNNVKAERALKKADEILGAE